jgi:hypothetical protein
MIIISLETYYTTTAIRLSRSIRVFFFFLFLVFIISPVLFFHFRFYLADFYFIRYILMYSLLYNEVEEYKKKGKIKKKSLCCWPSDELSL